MRCRRCPAAFGAAARLSRRRNTQADEAAAAELRAQARAAGLQERLEAAEAALADARGSGAAAAARLADLELRFQALQETLDEVRGRCEGRGGERVWLVWELGEVEAGWGAQGARVRGGRQGRCTEWATVGVRASGGGLPPSSRLHRSSGPPTRGAARLLPRAPTGTPSAACSRASRR